MPYVYSTATCDTTFNHYAPPAAPSEPRTVIKSILIKGGSGVAPGGKKLLATPFGVVTEVDDSELEFLLQDEAFKKSMECGFYRVEKKNHDVEKIIPDMELRDESSPIMPEDDTPGDANIVNGSEFDTTIKISKKDRGGKVINNIK